MRTDHPLAKRKNIKIAALEGEPLIIGETGSTTRRAFEQALAKAKIRPRIVMEIGSREVICEAVIRGLGISYVSEPEFVPDPSLRLIPIARCGNLHLRTCCNPTKNVKPAGSSAHFSTSSEKQSSPQNSVKVPTPLIV